jgi:tRNA pseudouridine55 synthase
MVPMNGYLLVDKPKGWTSFDVVAKVRSLARDANRQAMVEGRVPAGQVLPKRVKVGHTGTLDPLATGLLVILVGKYTKRAGELTKLDKTYEVIMKLGEVSTTADDEGEKTLVSDMQPSSEAVAAALEKFTGDIMQTPPAYSAMKIDGVRAYKLARQGKEVKLEARPAKVYSIDLTEYAYPYVKFTADVSSGTYIRSLVEDLGNELGTSAYMSDLRRTRVGRFDLANARPVTELQADTLTVREL